MSQVITSQIQLWRQKSLDGTITVEEMRDAIAAIRKERFAASEKSETSRTKRVAAKTPVDSDALLDQLF